MAYAAIYRIPVRSITGKLWLAEIEKDGYVGTVQEMKGSGKPIVIKYVDNDEEKITPIRASSCVLSFISDTFDFSLIIDDNDTLYRLTIRDESITQWRGFISTDDCSVEYTSGARMFVLTAMDGLGRLKDVTYKTYDTGEAFYGKKLLTEIVRDCLYQTGTELNIHIECNLYEDGAATSSYNDPFVLVMAHTKLFLYVDQGPKNMYDILVTIMDCFQCTIFQQFGTWRIKRMADILNNLAPTYTYYYWPILTPFVGVSQPWTISRFTDFIPVNASHIESYIKPTFTSKERHNYLIPDTPENEDMTMGDKFDDDPLLKKFYIDFWSLQSDSVTSPIIEPDGTAYRAESYNADGKLNESYVVVPDLGTNDERLINIYPVMVDTGDTISVDASTKLLNDPAFSGTGVVLRLVLYGDSSQKYTYDATTSEWVPTLTSAIGSSAFTRAYGSGDDLTDWYPFGVQYTVDGRVIPTTSPFPEGGELHVWFCDWSTGTNESWFKDIVINVQLFLNQVFADLSGEQSVSDNNLTSARENEVIVKLGDAPKRIIASALWRVATPAILTSGWGRNGDPKTSRLIDLNSQDLQKTSYRVFKKLDGDFKGITFDGGKLLGPGNYFEIDGLLWVATNIEIDLVNEYFTVTLQEFSDETKDIPTLDTEFKYLFNERS